MSQVLHSLSWISSTFNVCGAEDSVEPSLRSVYHQGSTHMQTSHVRLYKDALNVCILSPLLYKHRGAHPLQTHLAPRPQLTEAGNTQRISQSLRS